MTYAALWAFAQIEIANGSTLYNNGDGATTFGIPDMRGRLPIGWDTMGGTASGRLTTAGSAVDGTTLGSSGGAQNVLAVQSNLPNVALTFTGTPGVATSTNSNIPVNCSSPIGISGPGERCRLLALSSAI
jgi:microcystin-dependent protein